MNLIEQIKAAKNLFQGRRENSYKKKPKKLSWKREEKKRREGEGEEMGDAALTLAAAGRESSERDSERRSLCWLASISGLLFICAYMNLRFHFIPASLCFTAFKI